MAISAKELRKQLSPDVLALSAAALAELDAPTVAPAALAAARGMGVEVRGQRTPTEHDEQVALFQWAELNEGAMPELALLFAVPNGGYRPMTTAAQLKAEGVKAGVPDVCLPVARGRFHGLWLELKRADHSNHATQLQEEWIERLRHYFATYKMIPGQEPGLTVDRTYDREHALRVVEAAMQDYFVEYGD